MKRGVILKRDLEAPGCLPGFRPRNRSLTWSLDPIAWTIYLDLPPSQLQCRVSVGPCWHSSWGSLRHARTPPHQGYNKWGEGGGACCSLKSHPDEVDEGSRKESDSIKLKMSMKTWLGWLLMFCHARSITGQIGGQIGKQTRHHFSLLLPAAITECFFQQVEQNWNLHFSYQVQRVPGFQDVSLSAWVTSPVGTREGMVLNRPFGQINCTAAVSGDFKFCISNIAGTYGNKQVYLNIEVSRNTMVAEKDVLSTNDTLTEMQERMSTIALRMFIVRRFYNFARIQGGRDFFLVSSNLNYITCWSIAQSVLIALVGVIQVFALRHFFQVKTLTPSLRPRC
uniref:transmembrane emp24 domain-containing protein 6 n=1 Tax=Myxine glutinosa TaxID=7769 RepID=UPI00358EF7D7